MSTVTPAMVSAQHAPLAGADLREARESLGWSLEDVAFGLRIRYVYLEALEAGRLSALPSPAYAFAFIRTYARTLGLDPDEITRRFKAEAGEAAKPADLTFPVPIPERGLPTGAIMLLGLVMVIGAYAAWYHLSGEGRLPAEAVTAIPERLAPLAEQALQSPPITSAMATSTPAEDDATQSVGSLPKANTPADPAPAMLSTSSMSAVAAPLPATASSDPAATLASVEPQPLPAATKPESRITVRATANSWLQVKDQSGAVLLNRVLKAGETWPVPPGADLVLTTGNAGGTELLVDGNSVGTLGASGVVRRDLPLDADTLKDGKIATISAGSAIGQRPRQ